MSKDVKIKDKMIPCIEYCYMRFGKEYSPEQCDNQCAYAIAEKEKRFYREAFEKISETIKKCYNDIKSYELNIEEGNHNG